MSYIIAFVKYSNTGKSFPVECFRTDLTAGECVLVRKGDGQLETAVIEQLHFLNWDCKGRIECRMSECTRGEEGKIVLPKNAPINVGLAHAAAFIAALKGSGWVHIKKESIFRTILTNRNDNHDAYIFIRRNGVDLQLLPINTSERPRAWDRYTSSLSQGKVARHYLAHTSFNLYEGLARFSDSFLNNEDNLDRYFIEVGSKDKRTDELKEQSRALRSDRGSGAEIYSGISIGDGEPVYLSDGVWLTSDGRTHDWGR